MGWFYREFFRPSRPRAARGGIKAQSKRGAFGQSWWAKRWIAILEGFNIGARLGRGRSYARNGQVLDIQIEQGRVTARVQGSRPRPYDVAIRVKPLSPAEWARLIEALSAQALYSAKLLAGEMPEDIEEVFRKAKLSLFPEKLKDLETDCSCPDWSNPCKHIAAVYYLIGEEFDRDPFLLFRLRGLGRDELLARLGPAAQPARKGKQPAAPTAPPEPLPADPAAFWNGSPLPADASGVVSTPRLAAALPKRLGNFPFWRGNEHFLDALEQTYATATEAGLNAILGERRA
ncbi:MAG: SWIM zinc finger family protein [Planctomycetia bacterium]|nr:SWIM zinc finger family protein [Planctomycetia bacterium]